MVDWWVGSLSAGQFRYRWWTILVHIDFGTYEISFEVMVTGQLVDMPTRGLVNSRTRQLAD